MRDLTCQAEELGLYPEGTREPREGFKEELRDQLDLRKPALGAGWRWNRGVELGWGCRVLENDQGRGRKLRQ